MPYNAAIPELWHAQLLESMRNRHVYGAVGNRDFEGEISGPGDVVRIMSLGDPTVRTYTKNTTSITAAQKLEVADQTLVIDQNFYVNVDIDDIDGIQAKPNLRDGILGSIAHALSDNMDTNLAALLRSDGAGFSTAGNTAGNRLADTTIVATDGNAYTVLVDLKVLLDADNVPEDNRWVVVPPWYHGKLLVDTRFVEYGTPDNVRTRTNGRVGFAAGFEVHISNNVPSTATTLAFVIAGHPSAFTVAEQIPFGKVEFFRPPDRFSDAMKVLHVFGRTVTRPTALAAVMAENE
jgi:hypothetical protein